ncbi:hypothetical protein V6C39_05835 [Dickeya ananatis]|uniref:hypothetical protein n=1 Tax=Dickeya ananatis TaxID=3061286 RepID=UPI00388EEB24
MKLLLVGATGLVGHQVLLKALAESRITQVTAPVRRELPAHDKLLAPQVSFEHLPQDADWWQADAVICTLGTTIKTAGSQAAFYRVDHDYPLAVARLAKHPWHADLRAEFSQRGERYVAVFLQPGER